jgi:hypothetical protein
MRLNQQRALDKLNGLRVRAFLVSFWRVALAVLPRI